jgi:hypothetical protein
MGTQTRILKERIWKYAFGALMIVAGGAFYGHFLLLGQYAHDHAVRLSPDDTWNIRYQYGHLIFYISSAENRWLVLLQVVFFAATAALVVTALVRYLQRDIDSKKS